MARYPGATWKPITVNKNRQRLTLYSRVNLHVAVSEAASLHTVFNKSGAADSHFYVRKNGTVEQYVDTSMRANADYQGNGSSISIETQGGVSNSATEKWTAAQVETLAKLYAWCVVQHKIAVRLATSSKVDASSNGLSWHRIGIDGNFPALPSILAGRLQRGGGMYYSTSKGKTCPGNAKIQQIPTILSRARQILIAGGYMSLTTQQAYEVRQTYVALLGSNDGRLVAMPDKVNLPTYIARMRGEVQQILSQVGALTTAVNDLSARVN